MELYTTFVPLQKILSVFLNDFQAAAAPASSFAGLLRGGDLSCTDGAVINIGPVHGVIFSNQVHLSSFTATTITPVGLATDTWYYLYGYVSGAGIAFEYSTTVPDSSLRFKNGDTSRRYFGPFRTYTDGGSTKIHAFTMMNGRYLYRLRTVNQAVALSALTGGAATAATAVSLASLIPPHARIADIVIRVSTTASDTTVARVDVWSLSTDTGFIQVTLAGNSLGADARQERHLIETDSSRNIHYRFSSGPNTQVAVIGVYGFIEPAHG